jgi:hypothetical protein
MPLRCIAVTVLPPFLVPPQDGAAAVTAPPAEAPAPSLTAAPPAPVATAGPSPGPQAPVLATAAALTAPRAVFDPALATLPAFDHAQELTWPAHGDGEGARASPLALRRVEPTCEPPPSSPLPAAAHGYLVQVGTAGYLTYSWNDVKAAPAELEGPLRPPEFVGWAVPETVHWGTAATARRLAPATQYYVRVQVQWAAGQEGWWVASKGKGH